MEKQRFAKPYLGRFLLYRLIVGGEWRKYKYSVYGTEGWYYTKQDLDYACGDQLQRVK